jgi:hypothetical protein
MKEKGGLVPFWQVERAHPPLRASLGVVPPSVALHDPFRGHEVSGGSRDGRLWRKGSCDMKGGVAALLYLQGDRGEMATDVFAEAG